MKSIKRNAKKKNKKKNSISGKPQYNSMTFLNLMKSNGAENASLLHQSIILVKIET